MMMMMTCMRSMYFARLDEYCLLYTIDTFASLARRAIKGGGGDESFTSSREFLEGRQV